LTFTDVANELGISKAGLRIVCHKLGIPAKKIVPKLAHLLDYNEQYIQHLIVENSKDLPKPSWW